MIWEEYGLRSYRAGLFWLVNPDEYNDIAIKFPNVSEGAIVFARTGLGNLFLYEQITSASHAIRIWKLGVPRSIYRKSTNGQRSTKFWLINWSFTITTRTKSDFRISYSKSQSNSSRIRDET